MSGGERTIPPSVLRRRKDRDRKRLQRRREALGAVPALGGMVAKVALPADMVATLEAKGVDPEDEESLMNFLDDCLF